MSGVRVPELCKRDLIFRDLVIALEQNTSNMLSNSLALQGFFQPISLPPLVQLHWFLLSFSHSPVLQFLSAVVLSLSAVLNSLSTVLRSHSAVSYSLSAVSYCLSALSRSLASVSYSHSALDTVLSCCGAAAIVLGAIAIQSLLQSDLIVS